MRLGVVATLIGLSLGSGAALALGSALGDHAALADSAKKSWPVDPQPVESTKQWVFAIEVKASVPAITKVTELELKKPEATPRMTGRYAIELYVGTELLDRLRFNVPLNGDDNDSGDQPGKKRPVFRVNTKMFLRMADAPRAAVLRLVDRTSGEERSFRWPPNKDGTLTPVAAPASSSSADAGPAPTAPDAGDAGTGDAGTGDAGKR